MNFINGILNWFATRLQSKKFTVWLSVMIMTFASNRFGVELSQESIVEIIKWTTGAFMAAQAGSDIGSKGATSGVVIAKEAAATAKNPTPKRM